MSGLRVNDESQLNDAPSPYALLCDYATSAADKSKQTQIAAPTQPHYLMFNAANQGFLIDVQEVNSVIRDKPIIKFLPFSPAWFKGLSSIRNEVVSVVSFAKLWDDSVDEEKKNNHYILLRGMMDGFMFEVGELIGIRALDIQKNYHKRFFDGYAYSDGKKWQLINTTTLLHTELNNKMEM